ncbi:MAG: DDE-type integrase/transposase/recombinase [Eubacteriales bacterium]|nr:DDE-type integrase/transposase/recombinase [Eubacteriales bacterium]
MKSILSDQVAAFRYGLIAPIVCRQTPLLPGELKAYLEETASQIYEIPGSARNKVSTRTLERYLSLYREGGYDALKPQAKSSKGRTTIPAPVLQQAIELRRERPERSVEQIIFMLEETGIVDRGSLANSTLARQLRLAGASRNEMLVKTEGYRRFEAEDAHVIWQSDFQHTLYLPDPQDPKRKKKAMLFAILDDYSRYVVQAQFYWDEKLPRLEDSLKKAILRWGIPEQFYCDNGSVFSSAQLARICGKLGIRLSHSRPYRPAGRGKIERLFRFIDTSFKPEAYQQIEAGQIATLEELNQALAAWLDGYYHLRVHGGTKEKPKSRLESSCRKPRRVPMAELTDIFLWQEERKADKAGCIKAQGNLYEVDLELAGKKILLRYDPFDLSTIQVWHGEKRFQDAVPVDLTRRHHPRVKPESPKTVPEEGLSFFTAAEARRQQELNKSPLAFEQKEVRVNEQAL